MGWRLGQAYGQDLRDRVLAMSGASIREVAARFGVIPTRSGVDLDVIWVGSGRSDSDVA